MEYFHSMDWPVAWERPASNRALLVFATDRSIRSSPHDYGCWIPLTMDHLRESTRHSLSIQSRQAPREKSSLVRMDSKMLTSRTGQAKMVRWTTLVCSPWCRRVRRWWYWVGIRTLIRTAAVEIMQLKEKSEVMNQVMDDWFTGALLGSVVPSLTDLSRAIRNFKSSLRRRRSSSSAYWNKTYMSISFACHKWPLTSRCDSAIAICICICSSSWLPGTTKSFGPAARRLSLYDVDRLAVG